MMCPYCEKEMQLGYIPNGNQPVQWIPDGDKPSYFAFSMAKEGVRLVNQYAPLKANGFKAEAYYCADCGIVIAPTQK